MSRQFFLRVTAAVALGTAVLGTATWATTSSASAQGWSQSGAGPVFGTHERPGPGPAQQRQAWSQGGWGHGGWGHERPGYGRWRDHHYGHGSYGPQRCIMRHVRFWDGWGWVTERRRVCR